MIIVFLIFIQYVQSVSSLELRIYETAKPGTRMTIDEDLEEELKRYRDCFFELESNLTWFHFDEDTWSFLTNSEVAPLGPDENTALLHLLCADAKQSRSINMKIQITKQNRYAPEFTQKNYVFYVPLGTQPGKPLGRVEVNDKDPVIYNSQTRITVIPSEQNDILEVDTNGTLKLKRKIFYYPPFKPVEAKLSAIDFGSPQKHAEAIITVIPVTITQVRKVTVNVANLHYQIFEWEHPEVGIAERYRLIVRNSDHIEYEDLVDGQYNIAYFKKSLRSKVDYFLQIEAIDVDGKTPSDLVPFRVTSTGLDCNGTCSAGGRPVCYYSRSRELKQYADENGEHCTCYPGYTGISCEVVEHCNEEETVEVFGRIRWSKTAVNKTEIIPCPFGISGDFLRRLCHWSLSTRTATWQSLAGDETCRKQNSVLKSLSKVASYLESGNTSHIGAANAIHHVVDPILGEAAFVPRITQVYFDGIIAEKMIEIVADGLFRDWRDSKDNYTHAQQKLLALTHRLSFALPTPYAIASSQQRLALKTLELKRNAEAYRSTVGNKCAIRPASSNHSKVIRLICMEHATIFFDLDRQSPVLTIELEDAQNGHPIQIELKSHTDDVNYTCVRFDNASQQWVDSNIELVTHNQDNFVVCKTSLTGRFSLLPQSKFVKKHFLEQLSSAVPTFSAILAALGCIVLFIITLFKRRRIEFPISYLFFIGFLLHTVQALILLSPSFITVLFTYDLNFETTLYFLSISVLFSLAYISFALNSNLGSIASEFVTTAFSYIRCSIICICIFAIPLLCTLSFHLTRSEKNETLPSSSMDTRYSLHYFIPFGVTFVVISAYCSLIFRRASKIKKRFRYSDENSKRSADIIYSSVCLIFVYLTAFCDIILFYYRSSIVLAFFQCTILVLFTVLCYIFFCSMLASSGSSLQTESPTRSLERKRDISRGDFLEREKHELMHFPLSENTLDSPTNMSDNAFNSQAYSTSKPLVSVV